MPPPRPQILRITLSHQPHPAPTRPLHTIRPSKLRPQTHLPLTRTLASHSAEGEHHEEHESHYDPPGGWLWGRPPGEKYQKEGWENTFIYGYCGSLLLGLVLYAYKPDTSIQTWALEEARRRLEAEGILEDPSPGTGKVGWDQSSYRPGGKDSSWPKE